MSFLRRLAEHTIAAPPSLLPRLPSRYETIVPQGDAGAPVEIEAERTQVTPHAPAPEVARSEAPAARASATIPERSSPAGDPERAASREPGPPAPVRTAGREPEPPAPVRTDGHEPDPPDVAAARDGVRTLRTETVDAQPDAAPRGGEFLAGQQQAGESGRGEVGTSEPAFRLLPLRPDELAREARPAIGRPPGERGQDGGAAEVPSVKIHIGRIEVRAVSESAPPRPPSAPRPSRLDAYLTARNRERR